MKTCKIAKKTQQLQKLERKKIAFLIILELFWCMFD